MELRLTRRALDDLALDPEEHARRSADAYADSHAVVTAFVDQRSQSPTGQETTRLPASSQVVFNLHAGRWRGLTWHDEEAGVVWLLGAGIHRSGERDDAYEVLKRRDEGGDLLPTEQDYLDLEATLEEAQSFVNAVSEDGPRLLDEARANLGQPARGLIAGALDVGVLVEIVVVEEEEEEEVWIGIGLPPVGEIRFPPGEEWITTLLAGVLGEGANPQEIEYVDGFPGDREKRYVIVARWSSL